MGVHNFRLRVSPVGIPAGDTFRRNTPCRNTSCRNTLWNTPVGVHLVGSREEWGYRIWAECTRCEKTHKGYPLSEYTLSKYTLSEYTLSEYPLWNTAVGILLVGGREDWG